ncbi:D-glycerate dehydrogenase [Candidatus Woesebacteria bacterium CG22_combo_CG10-13_8_21_14_all_45_10]|uniref:D-glycerate dehydrogenase n=1 Tax=Candidatus Woesebacteria bacterium CG22_combo_CG10-13_8_21_14_all_45_10 TaxID=1975060 RepID=A0A2H0BH68_9BACT|nr:MAG: D-glycerate dehydrogenase [Candidatus Woesebacteria bacterium CG22_combo_CG10-13_8_21_14_all_45_10]
MKIFVTRKIPGEYLERLTAAGYDVGVSIFDRPLLQEELLVKVADCDGIISLLTDRIDEDLMDTAGPQLKVIANYAVGFDNIDVRAATHRGIVVTNTSSAEVDEAVAEHTWALILALARRIVEADESVRRGAFRGWEPDIFLGTNVRGKTLGIIGLGKIGTYVARRAKGYNMTVLYNKHSPDPEAEKELGVKFASLDDLLATSDVVTLHVSLTEETRHMINPVTLSKMKKGAFLVNTSRGSVVEEKALVEALRRGNLAGAALDVFETEPNVHPELIAMPNVITTPHIASATYEARYKMSEQVVTAVLDVFAGKKPQNLVNEEVWDNRRK